MSIFAAYHGILMIFHTKGVVLRTIPYGETSVVVQIFTELFGIQSYLVNGVRTAGKSSKAHYYQAASILDMQVYHNELKNLQRIKEVKWNILYQHILSDVTKNAIALFMVELLHKCLKQPEINVNLFQFVEDALMNLDSATDTVAANFPIYFSLHLTQFFGFNLEDTYTAQRSLLDFQEGIFVAHPPDHQNYLQGEASYYFSQVMKAMHPDDLAQIQMNRFLRRDLLLALQAFYALHMPDFGILKTLPILQEILS